MLSDTGPKPWWARRFAGLASGSMLLGAFLVVLWAHPVLTHATGNAIGFGTQGGAVHTDQAVWQTFRTSAPTIDAISLVVGTSLGSARRPVEFMLAAVPSTATGAPRAQLRRVVVQARSITDWQTRVVRFEPVKVDPTIIYALGVRSGADVHVMWGKDDPYAQGSAEAPDLPASVDLTFGVYTRAHTRDLLTRREKGIPFWTVLAALCGAVAAVGGSLPLVIACAAEKEADTTDPR